MSQLVFLNLGKGDWHQGFPSVTVQIGQNHLSDSLQITGKITGSLPPAPQLVKLYQRWQFLYQVFSENLAWRRGNTTPEIEFEFEEESETTQVSRSEFRQLCEELEQEFNNWLSAKQFRPIERKLRTKLTTSSEVRVIIETENEPLQRFPWHLWNFFQDYPQSEVALSAPRSEAVEKITHKSTGKVRILAILGNSQGLEVQQDQDLMKQLPNAEIVFLEEPPRRQLTEFLRDKRGWDILFYAGHSYTFEGGQKGVIELNKDENLTIDELKNALKQAIHNGLQLAIFNSCDGIGLAHQLQQLNIPQLIVMRYPVPDLVAQEFLRHFLTAFSEGKSLYLAAREARENLEDIEDKIPCASWLPVICQNPTESLTELPTLKKPLPKKAWWKNLALVLLISFVSTSGIVGLRRYGQLQPLELWAYDLLTQLQPKENLDQDPRILVVTIDNDDIEYQEEQGWEKKDSLADEALNKLLIELQKVKPKIIGLDVYYPYEFSPSLNNTIDNLEDNNVSLHGICKADSKEKLLGGKEKQDFQGEEPPPNFYGNYLGFSDVLRDSSHKIVRRHLLTMQPNVRSVCQAEASFNIQVAAHYLFLVNEDFKLENTPREFIISNQIFPKLKSHNSGYQGIDAKGSQIMLNYSQNSKDIAEEISLKEILKEGINSERTFPIVLIGVTATNTRNDDFFLTPYGEEIPGVFLQAQKINHIVSALEDDRPIIWWWSTPVEVLWIGGWSLLGGLLVLFIRDDVKLLIASGITLGGLYLFCYFVLIQGGWIPLIPSGLVLIITVLVGKNLLLSRANFAASMRQIEGR